MKKQRPALAFCSLEELSNGKFERATQQYELSTVKTAKREVKRAAVSGTIVDKYLNDKNDFAAVTLDDGTATLRVVAFKEQVQLLEGLREWDNVMVVGRARERDNEIQLGLESVVKLSPTQWLYNRLKALEGLTLGKILRAGAAKKSSDDMDSEERAASETRKGGFSDRVIVQESEVVE